MNSQGNRQSLRSVLLGGVLPLIIFTVVEETYGTMWGLICGMAFGVGEICYEWFRLKKVEAITWIGNGLLLGMGAISLFTKEGIWFKLQPAIMEAAMAVLMIGSVLMKKPFMVLMGKKQGIFDKFRPEYVPFFEKQFTGFTVRVGVFFLLHAVLATYAALYWSTRAWAILKGVGFTGSFILYALLEMVMMRKRLATFSRPPEQATEKG